MSDGCRDEAIAQERYFERMRSRLLEEEALYGAWNPETCPNIIRGEDDWCACGRPCRAMWCEGCNAHLGPWGAWRAVLDQVSDLAEVLVNSYVRMPFFFREVFWGQLETDFEDIYIAAGLMDSCEFNVVVSCWRWTWPDGRSP